MIAHTLTYVEMILLCKIYADDYFVAQKALRVKVVRYLIFAQNNLVSV
jgi:hypothetical protein